MTRALLYPIIAGIALLYLGAMVVSGAMPVQRQLVRFEASGVLRAAPGQIVRVELSQGEQRLKLRRRGETEWSSEAGAGSAVLGNLVGTALRVLHNSGPVREIDAAEVAGTDPAAFGLSPPLLSVALYDAGGASVLAADFGTYNPEGYLQYMRLAGDARLYLMSRFVAGGWSEAMAAAP